MSGGADIGPRVDAVMRVVVGLATVVLAIVVGRVSQLQLAPSEALSAHMNARVTNRTVAAPRGDLVDRRFRPLASTRFGYRVFVDPTAFPDPPDEHIVHLAEAIGAEPGELGERVIRAISENRRRAEAIKASRAEEHPVKHGVLASLTALAEVARNGERKGSRPARPDDGEGEAGAKKLIRYLRVSDVLGDERVEAVKSLKITGVHFEQRGVRDYPSGGLAASIIGKVDVDHRGSLGAEFTHEANLTGTNGRISYVRDALGQPLWIGPGAYHNPRRGGDVRLSIDLEIQRIATEELQRGIVESEAAGGRAVVMDPATGEVLAMVDAIRSIPEAAPFPWPDAGAAPSRESGVLYEPPARIPRARYITIKPDPGRMIHPALGRNRCVEDIYEPGSTFKPFVWATVTELGGYKPSAVLNTGNGYWRTPYGRPIRDVHHHATLTWRDVLVESSNIGMSQGAERITHDQMHNAVRRFGFGSRTGIGLPGETSGRVTPRKLWNKYTQSSVSFGQEVAVTPVQMARAFSVFARSGGQMGTLPATRLTALRADEAETGVLYRVLSPGTVLMVRGILTEVAAQMEAKMASKREGGESGWAYSMFGKSGTAQIPLGAPPKGKKKPRGMGFYERQYNASFIAAGPSEDPKLVVIVVIDDPGPRLVRENRYYGSHTAGPVVRRIMERSLSYLGVKPSPAAARVASTGAGSLVD